MDCVDETLLQLQLDCNNNNDSEYKVALLNLASRSHVCGRWDSPYLGTQEETIERRSAVYRHALDPLFNDHLRQQETQINNGTLPERHIPDFGCVTTRGIPIVRRLNWHLTTDIKYIGMFNPLSSHAAVPQTRFLNFFSRVLKM